MCCMQTAKELGGNALIVTKRLVNGSINLKRRSEMVRELNLWELSCEIETVGYKLDSLKNIVEILAERETNEPESGALWAVAEMVEVYVKTLEELSGEAMNLHRETLPKDKAKEKKK